MSKIEPYPPELTETIERLAEQLEKSPPESFLAVIHMVHILATEVKNRFHGDLDHTALEEDYERADSLWETVRSSITRTMFQHSSRLDPVQTRPERYLVSVGLLLEMIESLPGTDLGQVVPERLIYRHAPESESPTEKDPGIESDS